MSGDQLLRLDADRRVGNKGGFELGFAFRQRPPCAGRFGMSLRLKRLFVEPLQDTPDRLNLIVQIAAWCVVSLALYVGLSGLERLLELALGVRHRIAILTVYSADRRLR
jgi:hypothetical protein